MQEQVPLVRCIRMWRLVTPFVLCIGFAQDVTAFVLAITRLWWCFFMCRFFVGDVLFVFIFGLAAGFTLAVGVVLGFVVDDVCADTGMITLVHRKANATTAMSSMRFIRTVLSPRDGHNVALCPQNQHIHRGSNACSLPGNRGGGNGHERGWGWQKEEAAGYTDGPKSWYHTLGGLSHFTP